MMSSTNSFQSRATLQIGDRSVEFFRIQAVAEA